MIRDAEQRVAEAEYNPVACRRGPVERAIGVHFGGKIDDIGLGMTSVASKSGVAKW